jgi:hypothetical protein
MRVFPRLSPLKLFGAYTPPSSTRTPQFTAQEQHVGAAVGLEPRKSPFIPRTNLLTFRAPSAMLSCCLPTPSAADWVCAA